MLSKFTFLLFVTREIAFGFCHVTVLAIFFSVCTQHHHAPFCSFLDRVTRQAFSSLPLSRGTSFYEHGKTTTRVSTSKKHNHGTSSRLPKKHNHGTFEMHQLAVLICWTKRVQMFLKPHITIAAYVEFFMTIRNIQTERKILLHQF